MKKVDLNCDMGEGSSADERLLPIVTSANVACGFHAGDPATIRRTIHLARAYGVTIGAHPSFPDRSGFGRRLMAATPEEVRDDITYQIGALWAFCRAEGVRLSHVKVHGALYNAAAEDEALARAICGAVFAIDRRLVVVCLARSRMAAIARDLGMPYLEEAFADRAYTPAGALVSRRTPGAVIHDPEEVAERASRMVREQSVVAIDGTVVPLNVQTLCVHGDTPGAELIAAAIRKRLEADRVEIAAHFSL